MTDTVNIGTAANAGNGDPLRVAFQAINAKHNAIDASQAAQDLMLITRLAEQDAEIQRQFNDAGMLLVNRGAWAPNTAYQATPKREWVTIGGQAYVSLVNHVSGSSFSSDLSAGRWVSADVSQLATQLASGGGAGLVGFDDSTVDDVIRHGVAENTVHVQRFGAVGDGVANDTAALQAALSALQDGQVLEFKKNATYRITDGLISRKSFLRIRGNGATLKLVAAGKTAFQLGGFDASYGTPYGDTTGSLELSITQGASYVSVPGITQAQEGKLAIIYNAITPRPDPIVEIAGNKYYLGYLREIVSYDGSNLAISGSFPSSFTATTIEVFTASRFSEVDNLHVDLSDATGCKGIVVYGVHSEVKMCSVRGATGRTTTTYDDNQMGIDVLGVNCTVRKCYAKNIFHRTGGTGRTGYGVHAAGVNCAIVDTFADNCKHCYATAERRFLDIGQVLQRSKFTQDSELYGLNLADGVTPLILWPLDVHANAATVAVRDCSVIGPAFLVGVRNGAFDMSGGLLKCNRTSGSGRFAFNAFETPITYIKVSGVEIDTDIVCYWDTKGTNKSIEFSDNRLKQFLRISSNTDDFADVRILRNTFKPEVSGSFCIDMSIGSSPVIDGLVIEGNKFDQSGAANSYAVYAPATTTIGGGSISENTFKGGTSTRGVIIRSDAITDVLRVCENKFDAAAVMVSDIEISGSGNYTFDDNVLTGPVTLSDMEYRRRPTGNRWATVRPRMVASVNLRPGDDGWYFEPANANSRPAHGVFAPNETVKAHTVNQGAASGFVNRTNPELEAAPYAAMWSATLTVATGAQIKHSGGGVLVAVSGGVTGSTEPALPARYAKVTDGTVTWKYLCAKALENWSPVNQAGVRFLSGTPPTSNPRMDTEMAHTTGNKVYMARVDNTGASNWTAGAVIPAGGFIYPTTANGYIYQSTGGGTTGGSQPSWPTTLGATVTDNTVTWTCRDLWIALN